MPAPISRKNQRARSGSPRAVRQQASAAVAASASCSRSLASCACGPRSQPSVQAQEGQADRGGRREPPPQPVASRRLVALAHPWSAPARAASGTARHGIVARSLGARVGSGLGARGNVSPQASGDPQGPLLAMARRAPALLLVSLAAVGAAPEPPSSQPVPALQFRDVASEAGLEFVHENSPTPRKQLIETMPGGVAIFDYDGDSRLDVFFTNGASVPGLAKDAPRYSNRLFRNAGERRFVDVTEAAGLRGEGYAMAAAVADYDNDGDPDLFVGGVKRQQLFRNTAGRFEDVTAAAGLASGEWVVGAGFFDYDNDGWLDLLAVNYTVWTPETDRFCGDSERGIRVYCHPKHFAPVALSLYHNRARRPLRGRERRERDRAPPRARHGRGLRRLRPGRLRRLLRHQRQAAELPVPEPRRRPLRGERARWPAPRCPSTAARSRRWASTSATTTTTACPTSTSRPSRARASRSSATSARDSSRT